jgi:glycosyltransferase involved in cell wall biosynthesis
VPVVSVPGTDASLRIHPVHTSEAAVSIAGAAAGIKRFSNRWGADLVHANSIRAGVVATAARAVGAPPSVVYVRDCLPPGLITSASLRLMGWGAAYALPNSRYTASTLGRRFPAPVLVAHSPIELSRFELSPETRTTVRDQLGVEKDDVVLIQVAQLTPWKAQDDAIRILSLLRGRYENVRLLLVGSAKFVSKATRYDNDAYREWLGKLARALGVDDAVHFLGERHDVPELLAAADIALLPSWEEPFGRSLTEAMAMQRPVVATNVGGPPEILSHGSEGLLLPPRQPEAWARALDELIREPERRQRMGEAARRRVETAFDVERHVDVVVDVYRRVAAKRRNAH